MIQFQNIPSAIFEILLVPSFFVSLPEFGIFLFLAKHAKIEVKKWQTLGIFTLTVFLRGVLFLTMLYGSQSAMGTELLSTTHMIVIALLALAIPFPLQKYLMDKYVLVSKDKNITNILLGLTIVMAVIYIWTIIQLGIACDQIHGC